MNKRDEIKVMFYQLHTASFFMNAFMSRHFKDLCKLFEYYKICCCFQITKNSSCTIFWHRHQFKEFTSSFNTNVSLNKSTNKKIISRQ